MPTRFLHKVTVCLTSLIVLIGIMHSCIIDEEFEYSTSCVKYYHFIEPALEVKYEESVVPDGHTKVIKVFGKVEQTVTNQSEGEDKALFDKLCAEHGDVSFNRHFTLLGHSGFACYYPDFVFINISCEQDYDASHPACTSLNDLFQIYSRALYNWVQNEYVNKPDAHPYGAFRPLSEETENDIKMLSHFDVGWCMFWLIPNSLPGEASEKCYHIDCQGIDGIMYSGTISCILE